MSEQLAVVILAAGQGTRMKSALPKVLHEVAGRPLLEHVVRAVQPLDPSNIIVVTGHGAEQVEACLTDYPLTFVRQKEQLGTGHALLQTQAALCDFDGAVLVLNGDMPLLSTATLKALEHTQQTTDAGMSLVTCEVKDPTGLGRVVRKADGSVARIVEEKDASDAERQLLEINPGVYLFDSAVFDFAEGLSNDNAAGEYYITDLLDLYIAAGQTVQAVIDRGELAQQVGVNNREHLAHAERLLRERIRKHWLLAGVTMHAPEMTFIDDMVKLEPDVTLEPGVILRGNTSVGRGAVIGAYAVLEHCSVAAGYQVPAHTVAKEQALG